MKVKVKTQDDRTFAIEVPSRCWTAGHKGECAVHGIVEN